MRNFHSDKAVHDFECVINDVIDRDSAIGIATRYGLEDPGIQSRRGGGGGFSAPAQTGPGAHPTSNTISTGSFPGVKAAGPWL
jgi:hypothetical protein